MASSLLTVIMKWRHNSHVSRWLYCIMCVGIGNRWNSFFYEKLYYISKWLVMSQIIISKSLCADRFCKRAQKRSNIQHILTFTCHSASLYFCHLDSPARKRSWNIFHAHRICFTQEKETQVSYFILKLFSFI